MIVATATALIILFGGGNALENYLVDIKKPVNATLESKETRGQILSLSKALDRQLKGLNKELTKMSEGLLELHTQYDSKPEDFEVTIGRMMSKREEGQKAILETRYEMKQSMSKEEWTQMFSFKK